MEDKEETQETPKLPPNIIVTGDFVLGDKTGGDKVTVGDITDSLVAIGDSASASGEVSKSGQAHDSGQSSRPPDKKELYRQLVSQFDLEELAALCFDLDVDFEEIKGTGKSAKARELVLYMERRGQLVQLREAIQQHRS